MKQYTIRGIPEEIQEKVSRYAVERGVSVNKAFVRLIEESCGAPRSRGSKPLPEGLMKLFGAWKKREADSFARSLSEQRRIDEELWRTG